MHLSIQHVPRGLLAFALAACGNSSSPSTREMPAGAAAPAHARSTPEAAAGHADVFHSVSRVPGSTFIEILEVRARDDGTLIYCTAVRGARVVDARDPANMTTLHELRSSKSHAKYSRCQHLDHDGDIVYFTNRGDRIQPTPFVTAVDTSATPPIELATFTKPGYVFEGIAVDRGKVYVALHDNGVAILELQGDQLVELGVASGLDSAWGIDVAGEHAYVAESSGALAVVDVADPRQPALVGRVAIGGSPQSVEVRGTIAYVAAGSDGLATIDVSNPAAPTLLALMDTPGAALQVAVAGSLAFLADWTEVRIYDVADPASPRLITAENIDSAKSHSRVLGIGARGTTAFVGEWTGLYAYELSDAPPGPELTVGESAVEFGRVRPGTTATASVTVSNEGIGPLEIASITTTSGAFSPGRSSATVAAGATAIIDVEFSPADATEQRGALVLTTNDADEPERQVPVSGNRNGATVGDPAPELSLSLVGGGQWNLAEHRGKIVVLAYFATF